MSATNPQVPLLRLPHVAIRSVSRSFVLREIFVLSLTSKKFRALIKSCLPKKQIHLSICYFPSEFTLEAGQDKLLIRGRPNGEDSSGSDSEDERNAVRRLHGLRKRLPGMYHAFHDDEKRLPLIIPITREPQVYEFGDQAIRVDLSSRAGVYHLQWSDLQSAILTLIEHFSEVFNEPNISLDFSDNLGDSDNSSENAIQILKLIKNLNLPMREIDVELPHLSEQAATRFLNACQNIQNLQFYFSNRGGFQYRPSSPDDFTLDDFYVTEGAWVYLEDFMQCKKVTVGKYEKENVASYLNEFFKKWIESESNLERLEVKLGAKQADFGVVVGGLSENQIQVEGDKRVLRIQRTDGKKALIYSFVERNVQKIKMEPDTE